MMHDIITDFDNYTFKLLTSNRVELKEKNSNNDNDLKKCYISLPRNNASKNILINGERVEVKKIFHHTIKNKNKRCDYILIHNEKVYFIELKTSYHTENEEDYRCQFKGSLCITDYIDSLLVNFYGKNKYFAHIEKRYILLCKNYPISKETTSLKDLTKESNKNYSNYKIIQVENDGEIAIEEFG